MSVRLCLCVCLSILPSSCLIPALCLPCYCLIHALLLPYLCLYSCVTLTLFLPYSCLSSCLIVAGSSLYKMMPIASACCTVKLKVRMASSFLADLRKVAGLWSSYKLTHIICCTVKLKVRRATSFLAHLHGVGSGLGLSIVTISLPEHIVWRCHRRRKILFLCSGVSLLCLQ